MLEAEMRRDPAQGEKDDASDASDARDRRSMVDWVMVSLLRQM
jgi:hypothetical protein